MKTALDSVVQIGVETVRTHARKAADRVLATLGDRELCVVVAGDMFAADDASRRGATGDVRSVWRALRDCSRGVAGVAGKASAGDRVLLVLIGHGSHAGAESRLNLPGPDVTAAELAVFWGTLWIAIRWSPTPMIWNAATVASASDPNCSMASSNSASRASRRSRRRAR